MEGIADSARKILADGSVKIRVRRAGMLQLMTFRVRKVKHANIEFVELFVPRVIDMSELTRVANEVGLPVEAENGSAFPAGKGATDFVP